LTLAKNQRVPSTGTRVAASPKPQEAVWALSAQIGVTALQATAAIPLARLLGPFEYGQFAWVLMAISFTALVTDACTQSVLVRARVLDDRDIGTLWVVAVVCGVGGAMVLLSLAGPITEALSTARRDLEEQLRFGGIAVVLLAAQHIPRGLLIRQGRLAVMAVIDLLSVLAAAIAALVVALMVRNAWALVLQLSLTAMLRYIAYAAAARHAPWTPRWRGSRFRDLFHVGAGLWVLNLANFAARNVDNVLLGRLMGSEALGIYSRSFTLLLLPLLQVQVGLGPYGLRMFAHHQGQPSELASRLMRLLGLIQSVSFPLAILMVVAAQPIVLIMFGSQWLGAVPLVRAFAVVGAMQAATTPVGWLALALGQGRRLPWLGIANAAPLVGVAAGGIAQDFGLLSWGYALIGCLATGTVGVWVAASTAAIRPRDVLWPALKQASAATVSAGPGIGLLLLTTELWPLARVLLCCAAMLPAYLLVLRWFDAPAFSLLGEVSRTIVAWAARTTRQRRSV
jgi:PST family polysaccharide transporter